MNMILKSARVACVSAVSLAGLLGTSALAQTAEAGAGIDEIIVTAQRQAQSLQDVPIAVSAFSAEALERQQINNSSDLQLTLPNITYTKTNFTGSSFTIRGIGDLCVGVTCDAATGIAINEMPLFGTRLFETEFFDLERVEVLRGPQGTLFGRNATSGVVNFVTRKPELDDLGGNFTFDFGNYNSVMLNGAVNVPIIQDKLAVRVAGIFLNRDGMTENLYLGTQIDDRNLYAIRGSLRWDVTENTRIDLMAYYFHENDQRMRTQKTKCQRDPTGVLGCLAGRLDNQMLNGNSTFVGTLSSQEFLRIQGGAALGPLLAPAGLGSLYGPDQYAGFVGPKDVRQVASPYDPTYFAQEQQYMARLTHDFGNISGQLSFMYQKNAVDSTQDYNQAVPNVSVAIPGITYMQNVFSNIFPSYKNIPAAIYPNGVNGPYCTSLPDQDTGTGAYGGRKICDDATSLTFDRSNAYTNSYTVEGIIESSFDGKFNFLFGGIWSQTTLTENSYYVNAFGIDYLAGVLGNLTAQGAGLPGSYYLATPYFRNNTQYYQLNSYGIFGEAYIQATDDIKVTLGLRYNHDNKFVSARSTLVSWLTPTAIDDAFQSPFIGSFDADPFVPGNQPWADREVTFGEWTGRAVVEWQVADNSMLYFSYSRGYKSGGVNPPLQPVFPVPQFFEPEFVNAYEFGSKNTFLDGTAQINLTGFWYQYKDLQLSRIVARTSVNDNVDASIWGIEGEFIFNPIPPLVVNMNVSYLNTRVSEQKFLAYTRDPGGGRSDTVIIKDISNGSNCAIVPKTAGSTAAVTHVAVVNSVLGLRAPAPFPADGGINSLGAFSICNTLNSAAFPTKAGVDVLFEGVPVNIEGNELPQAPNFKFSTGVQYTVDFSNGMTLVPRFDFAFTGESYGSIFNTFVNQVDSYGVVNMQVQLNSANNKWWVRGYVQNLLDNSATTGLYVTDQSSGLFTNIFTLEPRRFGFAIGVNF